MSVQRLSDGSRSSGATPLQYDAGARRGSVRADDGTRLFVRQHGEGTPVVFMAGWALPSSMWSHQFTDLAESGLRLVAYDRRSHGRSDDPGRGYDYDTLADDLAAVLQQQDLDRVTLVAHSMAAGEAVRYLRRHGAARIARLALVAPTTPCIVQLPDNPLGIPRSALEVAWGRIAHDFPQWLEENEPAYFLPDTPASIRAHTKRLMLETAWPAALALQRTLALADLRADVECVDVPSLVIHGDRDASAPLHLTGAVTARRMRRAHLRVYAGAPHGLYVTHRDALARDLYAFVRGDLDSVIP